MHIKILDVFKAIKNCYFFLSRDFIRKNLSMREIALMFNTFKIYWKITSKKSKQNFKTSFKIGEKGSKLSESVETNEKAG